MLGRGREGVSGRRGRGSIERPRTAPQVWPTPSASRSSPYLVLWRQVEEAEGRQNVSVKRVKDELLEKTAVYSGRFDALDEQLHAARALAAQHKCESVERDTLLDGILSLLFTHTHTHLQ